jgi:hypothetical protein
VLDLLVVQLVGEIKEILQIAGFPNLAAVFLVDTEEFRGVHSIQG